MPFTGEGVVVDAGAGNAPQCALHQVATAVRCVSFMCRRLARGYGSRATVVLANGLGAEVAPGLFEAELDYLHTHEWARCADDVLWRRSKLGLHLNDTHRAAVATWCIAHWGVLPAPASTMTPTPANGTKAETSWN